MLVDDFTDIDKRLAVDAEDSHHDDGDSCPEGDAVVAEPDHEGSAGCEHLENAGKDPENNRDKEDRYDRLFAERHLFLLVKNRMDIKILELTEIRFCDDAENQHHQRKQYESGRNTVHQVSEKADGIAGSRFVNAQAKNDQGVGNRCHGTADIDAENRQNVGNMRIFVLFRIAEGLIHLCIERKHEGRSGNLVNKSAQDHAHDGEGNREGPGALLNKTLAHEFADHTAGKTGFIKRMGHDKAHQNEVNNPVAKTSRDRAVEVYDTRQGKKDDAQDCRPYRINGREQDNGCDKDADDLYADGRHRFRCRQEPCDHYDREAQQNFNEAL